MFDSKRHLKNSYWIVAGIIILCGCFMTGTNYFSQVEQYRLKQYKSGQIFVEKLHSEIEKRGMQVSSMLSFVQTLDSPMRPEQFARLTATLRSEYRTPKVVYFYSKYVDKEHKAAYEERQRQFTGNPYFSITPEGARDEYLPLTYTSPNDFPLGYDLFWKDFTDRDENILARNNHSLLLSGPLYIGFNKGAEDKNLAPNALIIRHSIYLPINIDNGRFVDANGFYGVVGLHFKIAPFMRELADDELFYRITDVTNSNGGMPIFDSAKGTPSFDWSANRFDRFYFSYGGRDWQVDTRFSLAASPISSWIYILLPFILSVLLAVLIGAYIRIFYSAYNKGMKVVQERIKKDTLTNLSSRSYIQIQLDDSITECQEKHTKLAVIFLDLDHFKIINDAFGHETGDKLLQKVSQRLHSILPTNVKIGRLGGDEFLILVELANKHEEEALEGLLQGVISQLSHSYFIDNRNLNIGCSIGVAMYPEFGDNSETLVKNADMAMYEAKTSGRATYHFYDVEMGRKFARHVRIETRLRRALQNQLLELHFQPQVDLKTKRCVGMEALMRWEDEELGPVSPAEFIPIAEQTGIILALGDWAFEQACRHIVQWQNDGVQVPPVAVNVSAVQLKRPDFLTKLLALLDRYNVPPSALELELTESILIEDAKSCAELLKQLSRMGMKLSIDDFGTGYSSLGYLKDLPFDCVKIDQVFIRDMMEDSSHDALTRAIISMSHDLNLQVIAEGITRVDQLERLREYGCDIGQGYLFSEALGANSMANDPMIIALNQQRRDDTSTVD